MYVVLQEYPANGNPRRVYCIIFCIKYSQYRLFSGYHGLLLLDSTSVAFPRLISWVRKELYATAGTATSTLHLLYNMRKAEM